ncbi:DnaA regulatory inactivator Hda [Lysobacteraceae bacterium NML93-0792]|nr:DnaA regulatory inactivator Hda [Xanthomonadaceae bacterium NML93-0792]PBS17020.1 DnaA regulatory inactivator Hda [Xanthomonadaceae bacterium NML93-0793]PBS19841.1 DnaA regulatory inactivator Hda [Xanthomonadaceae bacterium NML93-0831]
MTASSPQLPLALRYPPDQRLDTLVVDAPALTAQLRDFALAGVRRALYVAGPPGTGKTHLAIGICAEAERLGRTAAYLPLRSVAGRLRDACEAAHRADVIAVDGLDCIAGDRAEEIALFDLHNRAHDAGRSVLYTASEAPDALGLVLPDLRSRLAQSVHVSLPQLDDAGRHELLRLRADRRGLQLDPATIDWLLRRVDRDVPALTALLDRLDRASLASQRRLTVPFVRQVLADDDGRAGTR